MRSNASEQHLRSGYRADIDGLRAIAVMAVVFYHTSVPGFTGGFVGVDVFFVISGFLITNLVVSGLQSNAFRFSEFYERRARRLAPALAAMLLCSYVVAFIYFTQIDFEQFSKSLFATSVSLSNVFFMRQTANYFDVDSVFKPLLHTWSLAVEEQFYFIYPALLVLLWRAARSYVVHWLMALLVISFIVSAIGVQHAPQATFYLLPSRAWELLLGAAVSLCALTVPIDRYLRELLSGIGLLCIGLSIWFLTSQSPFPGINALVPCIGTALILWSSGDGVFVTQLLSQRYVVFVGLISYSLYLWHWPIIIFWKYIIHEELRWSDMGVIVVASLSVAAISWRFVEQPFRRRNGVFKWNGRQMFFATGSGLALFATMGIVGVISRGLPQRLSSQVLEYAAGKLDANPREPDCLEKPERMLRGDFCAVGGGDSQKADFLVWGDSLADSWMPVFDDIARAKHLTGWFAEQSGCLPLVGVKQFRGSTSGGCHELAKSIAKRITGRGIHEVVLIGRWSWYIYGYEGVREVGLQAPMIDSASSGETGTEEPEARQRVFERGVRETLEFLIKNRVRVWIVDEVAGQLMDIPTYLARNASGGRSTEGRLRSDIVARQAFVRAVFDRYRSDLVRRVDPDTLLCPLQESRCHIESQGKSLYLDTAHLSNFGARTISSIFNPMFEAMEHRKAMNRSSPAWAGEINVP